MFCLYELLSSAWVLLEVQGGTLEESSLWRKIPRVQTVISGLGQCLIWHMSYNHCRVFLQGQDYMLMKTWWSRKQEKIQRFQISQKYLVTLSCSIAGKMTAGAHFSCHHSVSPSLPLFAAFHRPKVLTWTADTASLLFPPYCLASSWVRLLCKLSCWALCLSSSLRSSSNSTRALIATGPWKLLSKTKWSHIGQYF